MAAVALIAGMAFASAALAQRVPIPRPSPANTGAAADKVTIDEGDPGHLEAVDGGELADIEAEGDAADIDPLAVEVDPALDVGPPTDIRPGSYTLEARLTPDGAALRDGVRWRIFGDAPGSDGKLPLLGEATGGVIYVRLDLGTYFVHAALGQAGAARRIEVAGPTGGQVVVLDAGGVRLLAVNGEEQVLTADEVSFDIAAFDEGGSGESYILITGAPPGRVVGLNAGIYHVVCRYGDANAIVRADIRVDAGRLTEATIYQKAARLTLKLVQEHGGEALADTAWSVVTPAGENVIESIGAFPSVVLSAGEYRAMAEHNGRVYEGEFKVEAGVDRDVEVLLR